MLKEIAGTRAYNILKKRKMETVEDVCQLFPSKYYDFSFINPLNTSRLDKNYAFVCKLVSYELKKQSYISKQKIFYKKEGIRLKNWIFANHRIPAHTIHLCTQKRNEMY